ncbi:MAG TPA: undecaprenyl-diphosphate phosphatase [Spirochaetia bacterium]|nr:undecaprenyl-diphosphate phosphatase [Spirochaetales bacterium]HRW25129.1 undecaprenyl-diphosphate phosphatase [Spirochaetia bacterium]
MTLIQAAILGLFQGIAEFLPISSSGHLLIFKDIMGLAEVPALFDVVLHVATLGSIVVVFRKRVGGVIASMARWIARKHGDGDAENLSIVVPAIVATALTGALGLAIDRIDFSGSPKVAAGLLIVTALILIAGSRLKPGSTGFRGMTVRHGVIVGLAQGVGVLPGISRSGISISAGLASGLERQTAGEFSFLLAIPAILGALVLKLDDLPAMAGSVAALPLAVGSIVAFAAGVGALLVLMPLVRKGKLAWFAAYLIPAGLIGLFIL